MSIHPVQDSSQWLQPGCLWPRIVEVSTLAQDSGALHSLPSTYELVEGQGIVFLVRTLTNLVRKDAAKAQQDQAQATSKTPINPFLPPERELVVADISPTHLCVLNKFNVVNHHTLLITRAFESQDTALTIADFTALAVCLSEFEGLAFYNGGRQAGASQPHKHLQMVPLPFMPHCDRIPLEAVFPTSSPQPFDQDAELQIEYIPVLAFQHGLIRWRSLGADPSTAGLQLYQAYVCLLSDLELGELQEFGELQDPAGLKPAPYNLLVTREWMLMIPRSQEAYQSIAVNALGFAGALLVRTPEQMERVKQMNPLHLLAQVAKPISEQKSAE